MVIKLVNMGLVNNSSLTFHIEAVELHCYAFQVVISQIVWISEDVKFFLREVSFDRSQ